MVQAPGSEGNTLFDKVIRRFRRKCFQDSNLRKKMRDTLPDKVLPCFEPCRLSIALHRDGVANLNPSISCQLTPTHNERGKASLCNGEIYSPPMSHLGIFSEVVDRAIV
jgi:hypothetical protein